MLSKLGLPGFGRANWQSTIRKQVRAHEKYADMAPWNGEETADIVYEEGKPDGDADDYKLRTILFQLRYLPDLDLR